LQINVFNIYKLVFVQYMHKHYQ